MESDHAPKYCPRCGAAIPSRAPEDLCPSCLARAAIGLFDGDSTGSFGAGEHTHIGCYQLIEMIAEGGFGIVYRARQDEPVEREVALKVIKVGMDTEQVIARFEVERQTLASLEHSNIARILDAGATSTGRPYFVMELIDGPPILEYCDSRSVTIRDQLSLFTTVCRAVHHAHQRGVLHRDLKPSNILVTELDGVPVPKVIDFGIAKALNPGADDLTLLTNEFQTLGTPAFMSPEQTLGTSDVDVRSDVYSLGVLFYQLLTGAAPLKLGRSESEPREEAFRIIREQDPNKPSTAVRDVGDEEQTVIAEARGCSGPELGGQLQGDLDWITLKALAKDKEARYASTQAFAEDIERYLEDRPVLARAPSLSYRARKFARRHRALAAAAVVMTLALVVAVIGIAVGYWRAQVQAERAEALAQTLFEMVFSGSPAHGYDTDYRIRDLLVEFEKPLRERLAGHPDLEARALVKLGAVFKASGDHKRSARVLDSAMLAAEEQFGRDSVPWWEAAQHRAHLYDLSDQNSTAAALQTEVVGVARQIFSAEQPALIRSLAHLAYFRWRAAQDKNTAVHAATCALLDEVEALCEASDDDETRSILLAVWLKQIRIAIHTGKVERAAGDEEQAMKTFILAESYARKRLALTEEMPSESNPMFVAFSRKLLGETLIWQRRYEESERLFRQVLPVNEQWYGAETANVADDYLMFGVLYGEWGRYAEAEAAVKKALEIGRKIGVNKWQIRALDQLADIYTKLGEPAEAAKFRSDRDRLQMQEGPKLAPQHEN